MHNLRSDESFIEDLAYVIEKDNEIIGDINYSRGFIDCGNERLDAVVLGPLAVHEDFQNNGLGSKLIEFTLDIAENKKIPFVFVVGDENYYHRFGFVSASEYGIYLDGTDSSEECPFFMIKVFDDSNLKNINGTFYNPDVFNVNVEDVDEFDRQFEFRQKLVLDGQLEQVLK